MLVDRPQTFSRVIRALYLEVYRKAQKCLTTLQCFVAKDKTMVLFRLKITTEACSIPIEYFL